MYSNLTIGYWLCADKEDKLQFVKFSKYCASKGINLVAINDFSKIHEVSLFIHKLNDLVVVAENGDDKALQQLVTFDHFSSLYGNVDVIDPLARTRMLLNRYSMSKLIEQTCDSLQDDSTYFIPPFCQLTSIEDVEDDSTLVQHGLRFPVICKPLMAESHDIVVVNQTSGLADVPLPCLAQTFVSHSQLLFKLYVLGDRVFCVARPSLPDPSDFMTMGPLLHFNTSSLGKGPLSHFSSDRTSVFSRPGNSSTGSCSPASSHSPSPPDSRKSLELVCQPSAQALRRLASALRQQLGLELFGADVIVDAGSGRLACIDVNTFPGYKGVPGFFDELASFLVRRARGEVSIECQMPEFIS